MNIYKVRETFIAKTVSGQRIRFEADKEYCGGYDFKHMSAYRAIILVRVNGMDDEVHMNAGEDFISRFRFIHHTRRIEHYPVAVAKRPRISK
jgi:hypothetical protein